jgi:hypothetical protein
MRDLGQWMSEYQSYNENFLANQELINELAMLMDDGEFDIENM